MAFENLKTALLMLLDEIEKAPDDAHILQEELREKLSEMATLGMPLPSDLQELQAGLTKDMSVESSEDDPFDNLPV
ncbi:MAG: hypothetical protein ABJO67_21000 [Pseudoruegeria sp.]